MIFARMPRAIVLSVLMTAAVMLGTGTAAVGATTPSWQHRTLAVEALSHVEVVVTATRTFGSPPRATVTVTAFRRVGRHWQLISTQRIGRPSQWFWFSVDVCSLSASQFQGSAPTRRVAISRLSLLVTPSIGCSGTFTSYFRP
jgi:hypothetical protein